MKRSEKARIREYVLGLYSARNGRNVHIRANGEVHVTIDGNGSQMSNGRDVSGGRIFAGWDTELLRDAEKMEEGER